MKGYDEKLGDRRSRGRFLSLPRWSNYLLALASHSALQSSLLAPSNIYNPPGSLLNFDGLHIGRRTRADLHAITCCCYFVHRRTWNISSLQKRDEELAVARC